MTDNKKPDDRIIIEQLGAIIIILGIINFAWAMFAAPKGQFKFEFTLLLLGLPILFGGMRVISAVWWLAWAALVPAVAGIVSPFFSSPMGLIVAELRLAPLQFLSSMVPGLLGLTIIVCVARQLGSAPVLAARASAGHKVRDMRIPLALGAVVAVIMTGTMMKAFDSEDARKAEQLVAAKMGPKYHYHTNSIGYSAVGEVTTEATVQAWNENELLLIPVQWDNFPPP